MTNRETIKACFRLLNKKDRTKLLQISIIQVSLGVFDLLGLAAIGILGALSVSGIGSQQPGSKVITVLNLLGLEGIKFQTQVAILGCLAGLLLVTKTLLSIYFTRKILRYLSLKGASVSSELVQKMMTGNVENSKIGTTAQTIYAISTGVEVILLKIVATLINIISDASLLLIIGVGLLIVDAPTALISSLIFTFTGFMLYKLMHVKAQELGVKSANLEIQNNELLMELISTFREIHIRDRRRNYLDRHRVTRRDLAITNVEINFQPLLSKYTIEAVLVIGAISIAGFQFLLNDATHAIASLTIFLAAGTRIAPAFLRLQQSAVQIRGSLGMAWPTLELLEKLESVNLVEFQDSNLDIVHSGFHSTVQLRNVAFRYPASQMEVLSDVTLDIPKGAFIAIVGPSGSGKSTLADVILGVNTPTSGDVLISGVSPQEVIKRWPGAVAYVPQDIPIVKGSIFRNIALGFESDPQALACAEGAIAKAQLSDFVNSQSLGISSEIVEGGQNVSGGQRQRIGVARALFTSPKLLVMDEATSALDGITEAEISKSINSLKGEVTLIVVAHRLSTIRDADLVVYLSEGKVLASGSFEEVRGKVPDFESQASLMGL